MNRASHARMLLCALLPLLLQLSTAGQKRWDGGAGDGQWSSALNWTPDGVPGPGEDVLLDNGIMTGTYTVTLPTGATTAVLKSLSILPSSGDTITLDIPTGTTAVPALDLTAPGVSLLLGPGAVLRNGSGAPSGETILMQGTMRILGGGHYMHRTARANAYLIDHLVSDSATMHGLFEFDVPGNAGYTVSLTGNTFGDLRFSSTAAGGAKSYSGSGSTDLIVRGRLQVGQGAQLTSTLTSDIRLSGDLVVNGTLNLQPVTSGGLARSLLFTGDTAHMIGGGKINLGPYFRNIEATPGSTVVMHRDLALPMTSHSFLLRAGATVDLSTSIISGAGGFFSEARATLCIGHAQGITTGDAGNLRTGIRRLDTGLTCIYTYDGAQSTGDALPSTIAGLVIDKPSGMLTLTRSVEARSVHFRQGVLKTTMTELVTIGPGGITAQLDDYGRSDEGWLNGHVAGPCIVRTTGIGTWRVPAGDEQRFAPIALQRTGDGEVLYVVEYHHAQHPAATDPGPFGLLDQQEYWMISSSGATPQHDAFLQLSWRKRDWPIIDSIGAGSIRIAGIDSSTHGLQWAPQGLAPLVSDFGQVGWTTSDQVVQTFHAFTFGAGATLSVLALTGSLQCHSDLQGNKIRWDGPAQLGQEMRLEQSLDGMHFSTSPGFRSNDGSFLDDRPALVETWYRLAFMREGLPVTYSNTCRIKPETPKDWKIHPQPARDHIRLDAPCVIRHGRFLLMDLSGTVIREGTLTDGKAWTINLGQLASGPHVLQVRHDLGTYATMVVVQ